MPRAKGGFKSRRRRNRILTRAKWVPTRPEKGVPHGEGIGVPRHGVRIPRSPDQETGLSPAVDRPHQRGGPPARDFLFAPDSRHEVGRYRNRPQGVVRHGRLRSRRVRQDRRGGQGPRLAGGSPNGLLCPVRGRTTATPVDRRPPGIVRTATNRPAGCEGPCKSRSSGSNNKPSPTSPRPSTRPCWKTCA